jgi:hypothetical protein
MTTFDAIGCDGGRTAIEAAKRNGGSGVLWDGRFLAVSAECLDAMERSGRPFAHLCDHNGRVVTIPVN